MTSPRTVSSEFLMQDPILKHLPSIELSRMVVHTEWKLVRKGDKIAVEGDLADHVYLIEKGRFVIRRKELKTLRTKHGFIGIEGVLGADRYIETIVALEDSSIITFSTSYIRELIGKNVSIGRLFFNCYVKRHHKLDTVHQEKLESKTSLKREPFPFASVI